MRVANILVFDELLTSEAAILTTSDALSAELGAFDQIALMAVVVKYGVVACTCGVAAGEVPGLF